MADPTRIPKRVDSDFELIQAIQAGNIERFPELVQRYEGALYNFGLKMCGETQDAEDVVQDTFLNVFRYLKGFRHETKFKNWLYRIATSNCIKKRRKSKFAPDRELSLDEFLPHDETAVERQVPAWASLPLEQVLNDELSRTLKKAILELPEKYRVVLVLRDIEGFSTDESAHILNLSSSNIKVRLHRARLFLRDKLKTYYKES
ncbi:MAG: sigma-70 family RNA polymerase sigma factor [Desulfobacteraceae bacterium]|jgi:RNA polymerase sigma-70 factor (ECF subfamily)